MINRISPTQLSATQNAQMQKPKVAEKPGASFSSMVEKAVNGVNQQHIDAEGKAADLIAGKTDNVHEVTIAMQKAKISFELMTEIRNKLMDTYREVSRIQM